MKRPSRRTLLFSALAVVLTPIVLCLAMTGIVYFTHSRRVGTPMPFDATVWSDPKSTEAPPQHLTARQRMLEDVTARLLPGRCEADIVKDLGASMDSPYFRSMGRDLIYVLGPDRGIGIDSEWLLIWLDDKRCFQRHKIVTD